MPAGVKEHPPPPITIVACRKPGGRQVFRPSPCSASPIQRRSAANRMSEISTSDADWINRTRAPLFREPVTTRTHTEEMLAEAGADISVEPWGEGRLVTVRPSELKPVESTVPGDPSKPFEHPELEMAAKTWTGEWYKWGGGGTAWDAKYR